MDLGVVGLVGVVLTIAVLATALNIGKVNEVLNNANYSANLSEAGGLRPGDDVRIAGIKKGRVDKVELVGDRVRVTFGVADVTLGQQTRALIKSDNALGSKFLEVQPRGRGSIETIPISQTDPGYSVNTELGNLTRTTAKIESKRLAESFDSMSEVLQQTPEEFRSSLTGVSALAQTVSKRDAELQDLLAKASSVSSVLADRNEDIVAIMSDGSKLFKEITARRDVIERMLRNISVATDQLLGLAHDNQASLKPALTELRTTATLLTEYRKTLDFVIKNVAAYARGLGESVASGPFFQALVANLLAPEDLITGGILGYLDDSESGF
jgi:phospholipid/cholesterol/gamma-HCH transport system substrate-binding protein